MNVMVTSAGRRVSLVNAFKQAAASCGGKVFAGDMSALAPALYMVENAFALPAVRSEAYIPRLLELTEAHDLKLIVPTIDTELPTLAENLDNFAALGCLALVSSPEFVALSGDKSLTQEAFAGKGIDVPRGWLPEGLAGADLPERLFVKPRDGSASRDIYRATPETLAEILPRVDNAIIQEELLGPEITIDAMLDFSGNPLHYVPRTRIRTLAGESIQGVTLADDDLKEWLVQVLAAAGELGAVGPITLQAFLTERGPVLIEVNPRFGGGFPLAYQAGGSYPDWLLAHLRGEALSPRLGAYQVGLYMTRYNTEYFTTRPLW